MKCLWIGWLVVIGFTGIAAAQAPGQVESVSAAFLEKRVPEELAADGILLSRRNVTFKVEQFADWWLVSLVDLDIGRVIASTKVDGLPADREAAVASMTHVAAELAAQMVGRGEPPPARPPRPLPLPPEPDIEKPPPEPIAIDDHRDTEQLEVAYRRRVLRFAPSYSGPPTGETVKTHRFWTAYQGARDQKLRPASFYAVIERPDLLASYQRRRGFMIGSFVTGAAATAVAGLFFFKSLADLSGRCFDAADYYACSNERTQRSDADLRTFAIAGGVALLGIAVGIHTSFHLYPIDENEAKALAERYNQRLRRELGLPQVSRRAPVLRDIRAAPYVGEHSGGFVVRAAF